MTDYSASLEVGPDGWCTAWVPDLPGLFVNEPSEKRALRLLPGGIGGYLRWLRRYAEPVALPRTVRVVPSERHVVRSRLRWGSYAALHRFERPRATIPEVQRVIRWMGYMRMDTQWLLSLVPARGLSWNRPGQARTIARHLRHIASGERWYLQRLALGPSLVTRTTDPIERLARTRRMAIDRLSRLTTEERARVIKKDGQWWSARKMLGRFLYHERYHLRSMARILRYHRVAVPPGLGGWTAY